MYKPSKKMMAVIVSAALFTTSLGVTASEKYDSSNVGISAAVDRYIESTQYEATATDATVTDATEATATDATATDAEEVSTSKYPEFDDRAIAAVSGSLNIRAEADENSDKVGTLARGGICLIKEKGAEWSLVASGNCVGYVKTEYLQFGDDAGEWCEANDMQKLATVNTTTLNVREKADENSECITGIPGGETYEVVNEGDEWTKLEIDDDFTGYVKNEYIDISFKKIRAVTVEEQEAIDAKKAAAEAAKKEAEATTEKKSDKKTEATTEKKSDKKTEATTEKKSNKKTEATTEKATEKATTKKTTEATTKVTTEAATAAPSGGSGSSTKSELVSYALKFVGNPYVYGGNSLTNGTDCSGFTMLIYKAYGYSLPHSARAQSKCGTEINVSEVQPGDLLFYTKNGSINHVAMYIGNGQVVHASTPSSGIKTSRYNYRTPCKAVRIMN